MAKLADMQIRAWVKAGERFEDWAVIRMADSLMWDTSIIH